GIRIGPERGAHTLDLRAELVRVITGDALATPHQFLHDRQRGIHVTVGRRDEKHGRAHVRSGTDSNKREPGRDRPNALPVSRTGGECMKARLTVAETAEWPGRDSRRQVHRASGGNSGTYRCRSVNGAGYGDRTRLTGLGSQGITTMLSPLASAILSCRITS